MPCFRLVMLPLTKRKPTLLSSDGAVRVDLKTVVGPKVVISFISITLPEHNSSAGLVDPARHFEKFLRLPILAYCHHWPLFKAGTQYVSTLGSKIGGFRLDGSSSTRCLPQ